MPLPYRTAFYGQVVVLHASVTVRLLGDLVPGLGGWRPWGGMCNAVALLLFVIGTAGSVAASHLRHFPHAR